MPKPTPEQAAEGARLLRSNEDVAVRYDAELVGMRIQITRSAAWKAFRRVDQVPLADEVIADLTDRQAIDLIRDLVEAMARRNPDAGTA